MSHTVLHFTTCHGYCSCQEDTVFDKGKSYSGYSDSSCDVSFQNGPLTHIKNLTKFYTDKHGLFQVQHSMQRQREEVTRNLSKMRGNRTWMSREYSRLRYRSPTGCCLTHVL